MQVIPSANDTVSEMHTLQPLSPISVLPKLCIERIGEWDKGGRKAGAGRHHEEQEVQKLNKGEKSKRMMFSSFCERQRISLRLQKKTFFVDS
jgi:hypothetical protein